MSGKKEYKNIEDGTYKAVIDKAFVKVSAKGNKMASLWFRVTGQPRAFGTYMLHTPGAADATRKMLARAGLKAESVAELETFLPTLVGDDVRISVYTRDGFQNVEILEDEAEIPEEDIPF